MTEPRRGFGLVWFGLVLVITPRASHVLHKCSTPSHTPSHKQTSLLLVSAFLFVFEIGSYSSAQTGLKLAIWYLGPSPHGGLFLPQLLK